MIIARFAVALAILSTIASCKSASEHAAEVNAARNESDRVSVGKVQREIRVGMTNAEVVEVLGSPNMVTTDSQRRENWVYDRISTETVQSTSSGGVSALILGGALVGNALLGGAGSAGYNSSAGARSTSQRTLTIIIKFDQESKVRDFAYRSSSF